MVLRALDKAPEWARNLGAHKQEHIITILVLPQTTEGKVHPEAPISPRPILLGRLDPLNRSGIFVRLGGDMLNKNGGADQAKTAQNHAVSPHTS
jgi:hypothetical protein